ncbi:hypothetical protein [Bacillus sp. EB600]|uniref:hypothetical protein n=1 Tax=Bacillus sp. EB600 TaxID=2806345 RepID=UPI00210D2417|nr:hypothetical protein [Bacillus sp. EB600]MCQ6281258.1 hypothetical protein [Bacillus sp. EB600]
MKKWSNSKWIFGGAVAVIVVTAAFLGGCQFGGIRQEKSAVSENPTKSTEPVNKSDNTDVKKSRMAFDQTAVDSLAPGWELKKSQVIQFPKQEVVVAGIAREDNTNGRKGKVIVVKYSSDSENWVTKWSGDILDNDIYPFYEFQSIFVTRSASQKRALALIAADVGGSTGYGQALALTVDENGTCKLEEKLKIDEMSIKQKDNVLLVSGSQEFGMHQLSLQGEQYVDSKTPASQQAPAGAVQVLFKLDNNGNVVLTGQNTLTIKVGQTIAFVSADAKTKEAFDQGNIEIFTDGGEGSLNTSNANRISSGNSYTCNLNGTVQFLLITPEKDTASIGTKIVPTLTVNVQS